MAQNKEVELIKEIIAAWESLPGDNYYTRSQIATWIQEDLSPVINKMRKYLKENEPTTTPTPNI